MILREAIDPPAGVSASNFYKHCIKYSPNAKAIAASKFNNSIFIRSCWDFADYQRDFCIQNGSSLTHEGFQIGSPWHGDIMDAPILFLSINPAITHRCFFPRWHASINRFTLAGLDSGNSVYNLTDIHGQQIANDITANCDSVIYDFLSNRFQDTFANQNTGNLAAIVVDGTNKCVNAGRDVSYWRGMKFVMERLLGNPKHFSPEEHTKRLMRSVLSSEVIFWGTKRQAAVVMTDARLDYFWREFTVPMLKNCGAKILFLVGANSTREVFNRALQLRNGELFSLPRNRHGEEFRIAAINNLSQPPYNYAPIVNALRAEAKKPGIVRDALLEARRLYFA